MNITPITKAEARGNSRPVSRDEFYDLAESGQIFLNLLKVDAPLPLGITGPSAEWAIKCAGYDATREEWGGITVNADNGGLFQDNPEREEYALTVKGDQESVSIPIDASEYEFGVALAEAIKRFDFHFHGAKLGIFRDDDKGTIDFDPVIVVNSLDLVERVGAATHAIGGAYCFRDGNGYFPPHIDE